MDRMRTKIATTVMLLASLSLVPSAAALAASSAAQIAFVQNCGQWPDSILYQAKSESVVLWFTRSAVYYQLTAQRRLPDSTATLAQRHAVQHIMYQTMLTRIGFQGARPDVKVMGEGQPSRVHNYFLGSDRTHWCTGVPSFNSIIYRNIYTGIDARYYTRDGHLEYDLIVHPGASIDQIQLRHDTSEKLTLNRRGELEQHTSLGSLQHSQPRVYQDLPYGRVNLGGRFTFIDDHTVGFAIDPGYHPGYAVVIDPLLRFSTFLGSSQGEDCQGIAVDDSGNTYIAGFTIGTTFPMISPYDGTFNGGVADIVVSKLSPDGKSLLYSTYIGGTGDDNATALVRDSSGALFVTGNTTSSDFPQSNPVDATFNGGQDIFALKLSLDADSLLYSTFFGGSGNDWSSTIALRASGEVVLAGFTQSANFPAPNGLQPIFGGGSSDGWIGELSADGGTLQFCTFWGGADEDFCETVALTSQGNCIVTGATKSSDFPVAAPIDASFNGGYDLFVSSLAPSGNSCLFSTYIGGTGDDLGYGVAADASDRIHVATLTTSTDFPLVQPIDNIRAGSTDAGYLRLSEDGSALQISTLLGGSGTEHPYGVTVDQAGHVFLIGSTGSSDFPTVAPLYANRSGGDDVYVVQLDSAGGSILFSSYLGGSSNDGAYALVVDGRGDLYCSGQTPSTNFPTVNAYDSTYNGNWDLVIFKIGFNCCEGTTGNVNLSGIVDVSDLSLLVAYLTMNPGPALPCRPEANVNGAGIIDLSDLSLLTAYLTSSPTPGLPSCP